MLKSYTFWLRATAIIQILTALVHSISLFVEPQPQNDNERQMLSLMRIKTDMGAGFAPSQWDLFLALSSCFTFVYLLGGLVNVYVLRQKAPPAFVSGIVNINLLVFVPCFTVMLFLTFLPPVILTALIALGLIAARLTLPKS